MQGSDKVPRAPRPPTGKFPALAGTSGNSGGTKEVKGADPDPKSHRAPTGMFPAVSDSGNPGFGPTERQTSSHGSRSQRPPTGTFAAIAGEPTDRRARLSDAPVVLGLPCRKELLTLVDSVRGTVMLASIHALREQGLFDEYCRHLDREFSEKIANIVPAEWISLETCLAHYHACEALLLHPSAQVELGRRAGVKAIGAMLGTATRLSRVFGATPWTLLKGADRIWNRAYSGGAMRVLQLGASDALVEAHANPLLCQLGFCRNSFRGFSLALYGGLSEQISIREAEVTSKCVSFRMVWK